MREPISQLATHVHDLTCAGYHLPEACLDNRELDRLRILLANYAQDEREMGYEIGYSSGYDDGVYDGYDDGYDDALQEAKKEEEAA